MRVVVRAGSPDSSAVPTQLWKTEGRVAARAGMCERAAQVGVTQRHPFKVNQDLHLFSTVSLISPQVPSFLFHLSFGLVSKFTFLVSVLQFSLHGESEINNAGEMEMTARKIQCFEDIWTLFWQMSCLNPTHSR